MSPPKWTAEHGNLLKSLRQNAGLDIATLARKHIVSTTQVGQLENGGDTAFYNPDIKFATGKKLLHALGHKLPEVVLTTATANANANATATVLEPAAPQIETASATKPVPAPKPLVAPYATRSSWRLTPQNFAWPLLFLLIALGLLGLYVDKEPQMNVPDIKAPELKAPEPVQAPLQPQIETALPEQTPAGTPTSSPTTSPATSSAPPTVEPKQAKASAAQCNWQASALEVQPDAPRKPAEYVHLVAQQDVKVCIKDAEQRVATLEMQAGDARSIYGPAPFKVYSTKLSGMHIYFQGQAIKLPSEDIQLVQLTAAAR